MATQLMTAAFRQTCEDMEGPLVTSEVGKADDAAEAKRRTVAERDEVALRLYKEKRAAAARAIQTEIEDAAGCGRLLYAEHPSRFVTMRGDAST
jgi:hypothetical protein